MNLDARLRVFRDNGRNAPTGKGKRKTQFGVYTVHTKGTVIEPFIGHMYDGAARRDDGAKMCLPRPPLRLHCFFGIMRCVL